jgi:hypothetical protein
MLSDDVTEVTRRLAHVPLFEGLHSDVLERIVAIAHARQVDSGHFFFNEGDQADEFFVLTGRFATDSSIRRLNDSSLCLHSNTSSGAS